MLTRCLVVAGILFCGLPLASPAISSPASAVSARAAQDEMNFNLEGKITEKSAGKLTVSSGENIIFHVVYNDKTEIHKKDGSAGTGDDLRIGIKIAVAGDLADSGEITAKKITIEGDGAEK
jgi:hypothetical protein